MKLAQVGVGLQRDGPATRGTLRYLEPQGGKAPARRTRTSRRINRWPFPQLISGFEPGWPRTPMPIQLLLEYSGLALGDLNSPSLHEHISHPGRSGKSAARKRASRPIPGLFHLNWNSAPAPAEKGEYRWFLVSLQSTPRRARRDHSLVLPRAPISKTAKRARKSETRDENLVLREEIDRSSMFEEIVWFPPSPCRKVPIASFEGGTKRIPTVLILGEDWLLGKELIARAVHKRSSRSSPRIRRCELRRDNLLR